MFLLVIKIGNPFLHSTLRERLFSDGFKRQDLKILSNKVIPVQMFVIF